jgi:ABC-type dipeptide/oligopeptide/nickel transport system ATPase subunit
MVYHKEHNKMAENDLSIRSSAAEYLTYIASTGNTDESIEIRYEDENIRLTQKMMAVLYDVEAHTINYHIKKILEQVGMDETCLGKYPHELSGGQLQRISIARALIIQPQLLICDEITSSLDQVIQRDIIELLKQCVYKYHMAILFVSHDLSLVHEFCHQVLVLNDGKIIEKGTIQQLYKSENEVVQNLLKAAYLNG